MSALRIQHWATTGLMANPLLILIKIGLEGLRWMLKKIKKTLTLQGWVNLKHWISQEGRILLTTSAVAGVTILIRYFGLLQSSELAIFDQFFRWRPLEPTEERILIVGIDEQDLQKYGFPIPDGVLAQLLQKIQAAQPVAVGLDIYRDLPAEPGHQELVKVFKNFPNLIGIEKIETEKTSTVRAPIALAQKGQIGFNNVVRDSDGKVRRGLLYTTDSDGNFRQSFALKLALIYLQEKGITLKTSSKNRRELQLGQVVFPWFERNDGAYIRTSASSYQFIGNLRGPTNSIQTVSMASVLSGEISPELLRNRIVVVGSTATSIKDMEFTSYSDSLFKASEPMYGVELQAHFISQIISTVLDQRPLIKVWSEPIEWLWILGWSWVGATLSWKLQSPRRSISIIFLITIGVTSLSYVAFLAGWWIPVLPPNLALAGSAVVITAHLAHLQQELKRSTDFLNSIINTIPDPIFVKNKDHQKVVLNQAYCKFVGYPLDVLKTKSDYDLFPKDEADVFYQQDELAFHTIWEQENEEKLTDAQGITHFIATKRSLHQDAAGNLFLVGVIRDITERKLLEENLKEVAAELQRSNAQLKQSAEHDPLTGLPNRTVFRERLKQSIEWAESQNRLVALLFLDLNDFKLINDNMGHHIGDLLLKAVAERLKGCLRGSDTVSRLGGDEFTVILPGIPSKADAAKVAQKILDTITQNITLDGHLISITTSIGISIYPIDTPDLDTLIQLADAAMYKAKASGSNQYQFLEESLDRIF